MATLDAEHFSGGRVERDQCMTYGVWRSGDSFGLVGDKLEIYCKKILLARYY